MSTNLSIRASILTAAVIATAALATPATAAVFTTAGVPIPLSALDGTSSSIDIGGLTFFNFAVTNATGDMPSTSSVFVTPELFTIGTQTTVGFKLSGGFLDSGFSSGSSDFLFNYQLQTDNGSPSILGASIQGNPAVVGTGLATVTDTWLPDVTTSSITISDISGGTPNLVNSLTFSSPFAELSAQKDILLFVPNNSASSATVSFVDQTYFVAGSGSGVPEPASLSILALGAAALLTRRRR